MLTDDAIAQRKCLRLLGLKPLPVAIIAKATQRSPAAVNGVLNRLKEKGYVATRQHWDFNTGRYVALYFATRLGLDQTKETV